MGTEDALREEMAALMKEGAALSEGLVNVREGGRFTVYDYQKWYTRALKAVEVLAPDRYAEFRRYYEPDPRRKQLGYGTYVLQDLVRGIAPSSTMYQDFDSVTQAATCLTLGGLDRRARCGSRASWKLLGQ